MFCHVRLPFQRQPRDGSIALTFPLLQGSTCFMVGSFPCSASWFSSFFPRINQLYPSPMVISFSFVRREDSGRGSTSRSLFFLGFRISRRDLGRLLTVEAAALTSKIVVEKQIQFRLLVPPYRLLTLSPEAHVPGFRCIFSFFFFCSSNRFFDSPKYFPQYSRPPILHAVFCEPGDDVTLYRTHGKRSFVAVSTD